MSRAKEQDLSRSRRHRTRAISPKNRHRDLQLRHSETRVSTVLIGSDQNRPSNHNSVREDLRTSARQTPHYRVFVATAFGPALAAVDGVALPSGVTNPCRTSKS